MIWDRPAPTTLQEKAERLDEVHDRCYGHDSCSCYGRLRAAIDGLPDPGGLNFGESPPAYGPHEPSLSQWRAMGVDIGSLPLATQMCASTREHAQLLSDAIFGDGTSLLGKADP